MASWQPLMLNPISAESEGKISFAVTVATGLQRNNYLLAVGNDIDTKRISGKVDVVAGQIAFRMCRVTGRIEALAKKGYCWVSRWHL